MKYVFTILFTLFVFNIVSQIRFHKVITDEWSQGGSNGAVGTTIINNTSNNTYLGAGRISIESFNTEIAYFSIDQDGDFIWGDIIYSYGGIKLNNVLDIISTFDGNFVSTAKLESAPIHLPQTNECSYYLRKFDQYGNTIWEKMYGIPGTHNIKSTIQLEDSTFAATGHFYNNTWLLKMDKNGDTLWSSTIENSQGDFLFENNSSGYTIISSAQYTGVPPGETQTYGWPSPNIFKLNSLGQVVDTNYIDTNKVITLNKGIKVNNKIYCAGVEQELLTSNSYGYVVALDNNNDTIWTRNFGASTGDSYIFNDIIYDPIENALYVAGHINEDAIHSPHIVKIDTFGNVLWDNKYQYINGYVFGMDLGLDEGVIVTGLGADEQENLGTLLLKTDNNGAYSLANIDDDELDKQDIIVYPNPASEKINIDISNIDFNSLKLVIYNIEGVKISERDYQFKETIQLDLSSIANGLYHMVITFDNQSSVSKKIVKQ